MRYILSLSLLALGATSLPASAENLFTVQDFNEALPSWGTSWKPGAGAVNGYHPSFYTGFAPRSSFPDRVHVRVSRGNQTRVSVVLDEQTVTDYLFDLAKRYEFYRDAKSRGLVKEVPVSGNGAALPQLSYFNQTIESDIYGILPFVAQAKAGRVSPEATYRQGLDTLAALNPGRVFFLKIDLRAEFAKWKSQARETVKGDAASFLAKNPTQAVILLNSLVFGRVNYTNAPSAALLSQLAQTAELARANADEEVYVASALALFQSATGRKYATRVLEENGRWADAIQCDRASSCYLVYPEFTAIYPTGSVKASVKDKFGNSIPAFATPGLWPFVSRGANRAVDNIRTEPYYGWAPKMDFEAIGNGFHNPAVRFASVSSSVKSALGISAGHSTLWSVMRGGVSHGCLRLPLGHVWEMRQIFPVEDSKMTQLHMFGSNAQDFDVYDVDGDGRPEVMGVEYLISYGLQGAGDLARREGADLEIGSADKLNFYRKLYGARDVFSVDAKGNLVFADPSVSLPSYLDLKKKKVTARLTVNGQIPLYEQAYERDKVQFYVPRGGINKTLIRLMGRIRGCAPTTDKEACGEAAFDREAATFKK